MYLCIRKLKEMKDNVSRFALLNNAGAAGAVLGAISAAYMFLSQFLSGTGAIWAITVTFILWAAKFIGCIFLMRFFMKRFASKYEITDNSATMRFGIVVSFCSALIFAAMNLANVLFISPDMLKEQMDLAYQIYGSKLDSNAMSMLENIEDRMPQITFFSNLTYCFLYGTVLSAILSRDIPSKDPFADFTSGNANKDE